MQMKIWTFDKHCFLHENWQTDNCDFDYIRLYSRPFENVNFLSTIYWTAIFLSTSRFTHSLFVKGQITKQSLDPLGETHTRGHSNSGLTDNLITQCSRSRPLSHTVVKRSRRSPALFCCVHIFPTKWSRMCLWAEKWIAPQMTRDECTPLH